MVPFLGLVALAFYAFAALALLTVFGGKGTDIQFILSALCATCGTVAAAGGSILERIDRTIAKREVVPPGA